MSRVARITASAAAELAKGVGDVLDQARSVVTGQQGQYIATGAPESIYGKLQQATARQYCRRYADNPSAYPGRTRVLAESACRPYLDDIGYGTPPEIQKPFSGGQCAGVTYRIFWQVWNQSTQTYGSETSPGTVVGPIAFFPGNPPPTGGCTAGRKWYSGGYGTADGSGTRRSIGEGCFSSPSVRNMRVVRVDALPDNCGDPAPIVGEPGRTAPVGPVREPFNPSPDINIDIGVQINVDGTVNIDFGTGPITIDPFPEGGGDGGSGGGPAEPPPGDVGSPGSPEGTGEGGEAEGEAPPGSVLVGLKIAIVGLPEKPNEYAPGVYRGVAYIYMGTATGLDQDYAGSMLSDGQFVFAEKDNLTHWRVRANNEYNLNVTPYYREVDES